MPAEFDMSAMLAQVQSMQQQMEKMQQDLANVTVEGAAGGGMVKVVASADMRIKSIVIDDAAMKEDRDLLQDLIVAAINSTLEKAREKAADDAQQRMGSMLPPGLAGQIPGL